MTGTPFILDERGVQKLERLRRAAAKSPTDMPAVMKLIATPEGKRAHMKRMSALTVYLPIAYAVTFSIETGHPTGTYRHMSMSVNRVGRTPLPETVWMVAEKLGFEGGISACMMWLEEGDYGTAVNLIQPVAVQQEACA